MSKLSSNQLQEYNDNSYVTPTNILSKDKAMKLEKKQKILNLNGLMN